MKKVFIKYNPYKLETEIRVDGAGLAKNSVLGARSEPGSRLQEWIEELPSLLIDEYNDKEFEVMFHGTLLDYEDLTEVFTAAYEAGRLTAKLERVPAKETSDKEILIEEVFREIQEGPFEDLRDPQINASFELAKSDEFEICVVATMSAGKSTMINSMLGTKLMPSKQEACTAIITRIKDRDDIEHWEAEVYDSDQHLIESHSQLTREIMEHLNADPKVSLIKATGNIPFVEADDTALVLIDTPGPNNSRDPNHKRVQSNFLSKSSKSLVLYIMDAAYGTDDEKFLLQNVAESMSVGGKQSKDRFIFVINKMDSRRKEDGDPKDMLSQIHEYLKGFHIENPKLFPAAALPAMNIRMMKNGIEVDEDTIDETDMIIRKMNRNELLHFENYATMSNSLRGRINGQLTEAREKGDSAEEALIHTGIVSIEAAIRQYVQKYAKTAKIKNIVDTFMHKLEEVGCFEQTKQEIASQKEHVQEVVRAIEHIRTKIDEIKGVQKFQTAVKDAMVKVSEDSEKAIQKLLRDYQKELTKKLTKHQGKQISPEEALSSVKDIKKQAAQWESNFQTELEGLVKKNLVDTSDALLDQYKKKVQSLTEELDFSGLSGIQIKPLEWMGGSLSQMNFSVEDITKSETVDVGGEMVKNPNKKWYKPWTWFDDAEIYVPNYQDVEYVDGSEFAKMLAPIQKFFVENAENAIKHAEKESEQIAKKFEIKIKGWDNIIKGKLQELEDYATDRKRAEERVKETERRLAWLEKIKNKVESILEI